MTSHNLKAFEYQIVQDGVSPRGIKLTCQLGDHGVRSWWSHRLIKPTMSRDIGLFGRGCHATGCMQLLIKSDATASLI